MKLIIACALFVVLPPLFAVFVLDYVPWAGRSPVAAAKAILLFWLVGVLIVFIVFVAWAFAAFSFIVVMGYFLPSSIGLLGLLK